MAKNIAVADDVYSHLSKLKREGESFSDVLRRLLTTKGMLSDLSGSKTFSDEEWQKVEEAFDTQQDLDQSRKRSLLDKVS